MADRTRVQTHEERIAELERGLSLITRTMERVDDDYGSTRTHIYNDKIADLERQKTLILTLLENERLKVNLEEYEIAVQDLKATIKEQRKVMKNNREYIGQLQRDNQLLFVAHNGECDHRNI